MCMSHSYTVNIMNNIANIVGGTWDVNSVSNFSSSRIDLLLHNNFMHLLHKRFMSVFKVNIMYVVK